MKIEKCILISKIHFVHRRSPLGSGHFVIRRLLWAGGTTTEAPVRRHDHVKNDTFHCARKSIRQKAAEPDFSETYLVGILSEKKPNQAPSQVPSALVQEAEKKQYFPARYNMEQMHNTILLLVRNWSKKRAYTK